MIKRSFLKKLHQSFELDDEYNQVFERLNNEKWLNLNEIETINKIKTIADSVIALHDKISAAYKETVSFPRELEANAKEAAKVLCLTNIEPKEKANRIYNLLGLESEKIANNIMMFANEAMPALKEERPALSSYMEIASLNPELFCYFYLCFNTGNKIFLKSFADDTKRQESFGLTISSIINKDEKAKH